jgi:TolA-binding protein
VECSTEATRATLMSEVAWALRATGKLDAARDAYAAVLELPGLRDDPRAHAALAAAEIAVEQDRCADALPTLQKLADAESGSPDVVRERALFRLGQCAVNAEDAERSAAVFAELLKDFPNSQYTTRARLYCGDALLRMGRASAARAYLERAAEAEGDDATRAAAMLRLGECLATEQRWVRSEKVLSDYLGQFADSPQWFQAQFGIAWAREHQSRYNEAIAAYRAVVDRHAGATAARAQFQIGECLFAQKQFDEAVRELLKVDILYAYPEWSAAALYEAGRCFEQLRKPVEAKRQFQAVVDRFGDSAWANSAADRLPQLTANLVPGR